MNLNFEDSFENILNHKLLTSDDYKIWFTNHSKADCFFTVFSNINHKNLTYVSNVKHILDNYFEDIMKIPNEYHLQSIFNKIIYLPQNMDLQDTYWDPTIFFSNLLIKIIENLDSLSPLPFIFIINQIISGNQQLTKSFILLIFDRYDNQNVKNLWTCFINDIPDHYKYQILHYIISHTYCKNNCTKLLGVINIIDLENYFNKILYQICFVKCHSYHNLVNLLLSAFDSKEFHANYIKLVIEWGKLELHSKVRHYHLTKLLLVFSNYINSIEPVTDTCDDDNISCYILQSTMKHMESNQCHVQNIGFIAIKYVVSKFIKFECEEIFEIDPDILIEFKDFLQPGNEKVDMTTPPSLFSDDIPNKVSLPFTDKVTKMSEGYLQMNLGKAINEFQTIPSLEIIIKKIDLLTTDRGQNSNEPEILKREQQLATDESIIKEKFMSLEALLNDLLNILTFEPIDFEQFYMHLFYTVFFIDMENTLGGSRIPAKLDFLRRTILQLIILQRPVEINKQAALKLFEWPTTSLTIVQKVELLKLFKGCLPMFNTNLNSVYNKIFGGNYLSQLSSTSREVGVPINLHFVEKLLSKISLVGKSAVSTEKSEKIDPLNTFYDPWFYGYYEFYRRNNLTKVEPHDKKLDSKIEPLHVDKIAKDLDELVHSKLLEYLYSCIANFSYENGIRDAIQCLVEILNNVVIAKLNYKDIRKNRILVLTILDILFHVFVRPDAYIKLALDISGSALTSYRSNLRNWLKKFLVLSNQEYDEEILTITSQLIKFV